VNLPPAGEFVRRERVDPNSGTKQTEFFGRESFIKGLCRPARKVSAFVTKQGVVFCGPPPSRSA